MHIIKPQSLGLSFRPMEFRHRFGLSVSGYLHVPFAQAERGTLWAEQSMWDFLAKEMASPVIDEGIAKLHPEFLVHGHAYAPAVDTRAVAVRARIGQREKTVLVFGERRWEGRDPTAPLPFSKIPLDWAHAYGGPDHPANPQGKGRAVLEGIRALPHLELPHDRLLEIDQAIAPAAFGPLDLTHPQRAAWRGTYDEDWLTRHAPGFAPDTDWRFFNLASQDQWFDAPLKGDEDFAFDHMHPDRPYVAGRLPGLRVRVFAGRAPEQGSGEPATLDEIPMQLTTVWCFPHAERLVLVFHGLAQTGRDDACDITRLLGAVERIDQPRDPQHYLDTLNKRATGRHAALHALDDSALLPPGIDTADPATEAAQAALRPDGLQEDAQYRRAAIDVEMARDQVRTQGKDPDALGLRLPPRQQPPKPEEMPAFIERTIKDMEAQEWAALEDTVTLLENAREFAQKHRVDLKQAQHRGPPRFSARDELARLESAHAGAGKAFDRNAFVPRLQQAEAVARSNYLQSAHRQPPADPLPAAQAAERRRELQWMLAHGFRRWLGFDLTGVDLSNLDLRGVDMTGSWLESANLTNANLTGAVLRLCVLSHACLEGAVAIEAQLQGSNLGGARLANAVFDRADLTGAQLGGTALVATQLREAVIDNLQSMDTTWGPADWSGARGAGLLFHKLDLRGLVLDGARLTGCQFLECRLEGLSARDAVFTGSTFVGCRLDDARLAGTNLSGATFVQSCVLRGADLSDARLDGANLADCDLGAARLTSAVLDGAHLAGACFEHCDAELLSARGAMLSRSRWAGARLSGANLREAILQHADLRGCDLRNANLFGADLSRIQLDADARFDGALLTRARTYPRLTPEQQAAAARQAHARAQALEQPA
ncbi:DUF2169 domain-containing protein [Variovorax paradoxus]|uniref:DUF2169 family type VI secretion system accessory protein n=1 Tax=Variovorax paradoxus TaxID=34073 RepID=UPI001ABC2DA7